MAVIHRTIGVGGDFADWSAAWIWLCTIDPLGDDYVFEQISDCTINNTWPNTGLAANQVDLNGHYVKFYCPWGNSHQGNPNKGYVTNLQGTPNGIFMAVTPGNLMPNDDRIIIENLYFKQLDNNNLSLVGVRPWSNLNGLNIEVKNVIIKGFSNVVAEGLEFYVGNSNIYCSNIKIFNLARGFAGYFGNISLAAPVPVHIAENMTIYNCGGAAGSRGIALGCPPAATNIRHGWIMRNVVSCDCPIQDWETSLAAGIYNFYNCADSDNTLATGGGTIVGCIHNIATADEFQSLDDTNPNFLKLKEGKASLNAVSSPDKGKAPLKVDFNADVLFQDYAPNLGKGGCAPTLQDTDIAGKPRPGADDAYSIGAHEQQYSNFPEA